MMALIIIIHVIACVVLIALVLIQRGRGGGLVESLSGVESMFGTKTSSFLTRTTTVFSVVFFLTCLSLAVLSVRQSKSLLRNIGESNSKPPQTEAPAQSQSAQAQPKQPLSTPPAAPLDAKQAQEAPAPTPNK